MYEFFDPIESIFIPPTTTKLEKETGGMAVWSPGCIVYTKLITNHN